MTDEPKNPAQNWPTQSDVARMAGVSRATVSYVVNGVDNGKVPISQTTRARVLEAVETLGYVPDAGAQALRSGATKTIGLIIPDLHNPHFWENADGVQQEARAAGYRLLLSSMDLNAKYGEDAFKDLSGRRIDALVLMGNLVDNSAAVRKILKSALKRGLPSVEIRDRRPQRYKMDCVIADYRTATAEAMAHLLGFGHRRIGLLYAVADEALGHDRLIPYQEGLHAAGLPADPDLIVRCGPTLDEGFHAALQLLSLPERPTAVVAINDQMALATLRAAGDLNLRVPEDLSIVGFDDTVAARFSVPRLTTATKDAVRLGREAARMVLNRLQDPNLPQQVAESQGRFIIRESTGPAPISV